MTNSSYLVRREIYQNKNASKVVKTDDELPSDNHGTDYATEQSGINEKRQPGDVPGAVSIEKNNK
jgi:hypothetical protein